MLAVSDGKVVGFASLEPPDQLDFLYSDTLRQRCGIARVLFNSVKQAFDKLSDETLTADVSITAGPFFEAKCFHVVRENHFSMGGVPMMNYRMELADHRD